MTWFAYPEDEGTTGSTNREKWDKNAAANLATLMYEGNAADYVVTGFDVSVSAGEATVSPGLARVSDVSANDHTENEVRDWGVTYAVGLSDPVTVPVSDGDTLHIAFDATQGDGGSIETNGAAVGIEIASIESGAAVPTNRNPSAAFQDASVETAPSSPTDVARKQEVDENATTIGGKADDPHGDAAHSEDYAKSGESQPPEGHDNTAHTEQYAVDGTTQPPETHGDTEHDATVPSQTEVDGKASDPHGSEAHSENYAVDGDTQPPETHGDTEHDTTVPSTSDVDAVSTDLSGHEAADGDVHGVVSPDTVAGKSDVDDHEASTGDVHGVAAGDSVASQSDVDGKASDPHGNEAHSSTFATDGDTQPPEVHGDADHDATVPSQTEVDGKASDPHGDAAHSETYSKDGHDHSGETISPATTQPTSIGGTITGGVSLTDIAGEGLDIVEGVLSAGGGGGIESDASYIYVSGDQPTNPTQNDLWVNLSVLGAFVYLNGEWVAFTQQQVELLYDEGEIFYQIVDGNRVESTYTFEPDHVYSSAYESNAANSGVWGTNHIEWKFDGLIDVTEYDTLTVDWNLLVPDEPDSQEYNQVEEAEGHSYMVLSSSIDVGGGRVPNAEWYEGYSKQTSDPIGRRVDEYDISAIEGEMHLIQRTTAAVKTDGLYADAAMEAWSKVYSVSLK